MLTHKVRTAVFWSGADLFLRHGLQFGISIALARLLSPDEFGTVALMFLFTGIASAFVDGGFSSALIQRQDISHTDEATVFWFNLAMGAAMAVALLVAAPVIAGFYARPILEPLTVVMAANVFLSALGSIHVTLLTKRLDFRTQMKIGAMATLASGCVAVMMALHGYGVWALASQTLIATGTTCGLLWILNPWRPSKTFSGASARRLFRFGGYLMISALLDICYSRLYTLLIGRFYGVRELGLYERADSTVQLPAGVLTGIFSRVAFPLFSAASHDRKKLRHGVQLSVRVMMLVNVPTMLGLAAVAEPLVLTLFGVQWLSAVPVLQVLCLGGVFWPLHVINLNALMAQGHSHLFFRLELAKKLLGLVLLIGGTLYGVMGVAWSQVVFGILAFFINAYYTKQHLKYGVTAQMKDFVLILTVGLLMSGTVHWISLNWQVDDVKKLIGMVVFGVVFYISTIFAFASRAVDDLVRIFKVEGG